MSPRKIPLRKLTASTLVLNLTLAAFALVTVAGFFLLDTRDLQPAKAFNQLFSDLGRMFLSPSSKHFTLEEALVSLLITLGLGFMTTLFGAVLGLVFGLLAARNLSKSWISAFLRGFVAIIRAVPTVLWVLIFAIGAGLGSVAAIVGMTFHSFGYLLKAYSETFEEIEPGTIEALKASGANWMQIVTQAVLPSSMGGLISWTFLRFEINFTNAVAMGAAAGAGGIGFDLYMSSSHYLNLGEVGYITWLILIVAIILEVGATRLKKSQKIHP